MSDLNQVEVEYLILNGYSPEQIEFLNIAIKADEIKKSRYTRLGYKVTCDVIKSFSRTVSDRNRHFSKRCGLEFDTFMREVVVPLEMAVAAKRLASDRKFSRRTQLEMKYRVFRTLCFLRNETPMTLTDISGQAPSTVSKDCERVVTLMAETLTPKWVWMPKHDTPEYECLRGAGDFRKLDLDHVPYSADATIIIIGAPTKFQGTYYHGGKDKHCFLFVTAVDGFGKTRCSIGPVRGRRSEIDLISSSGFFDKIKPCVYIVH